MTAAEKEEQAVLRKDYIANVRANLRGQLNQINIQNEDGSIENLGENFPGIYSHRYALENGGQVNLNKSLINKVAGSKA